MRGTVHEHRPAGPAPADLWACVTRPELDQDRPALGELTYRDVLVRASDLADRLRARGVRPGEPIGLHGENRPDWVIALLALVGLGASPLLLPADCPPAEVRRLLAAAGARRQLWTESTEAAGGSAESTAVGDVPLLVADAGATGPDRQPGTVLLVSSGSTGAPKVVERSPRSVVDEGLRYQHAGLARADESVLLPLPLSHAYALGWLAGVLVAGGHAVPTPPRAVGAVHTALRRGAHVLVTVPGLARVLARRAARTAEAPPPALHRVMAGAGYVDQDLDALWTRTFGVGVSRNYGSSETGAVLWGEPGLPSGAVGRPMPGVAVDLLAPDGRVLAGPAQGDLAVVLEDGTAHRMHDLAERDEQGTFRILGRARRGAVRRGSRWVSTPEVESVLRRAPGVADLTVTVTGAADSDDQGLTVEYVAADDTAAGPEQLRAHARAHLATYKVPDRFLPYHRLRRSSVGKPQAAPTYHLSPAAPRTTADRTLASALSVLDLLSPLATGVTSADLARGAGLRTDVLPLLLDTAVAAGLLTTDATRTDGAPAPWSYAPETAAGRALADVVRGRAPGPPATPEPRAALDGPLPADDDAALPVHAAGPASEHLVSNAVHGPAGDLGRLAALLCPGGLLVVKDEFVRDPLALSDEPSRTAVVDWLVRDHLRWWTVQELQAGLEAVGLHLEETHRATTGLHATVTARKPT
ncbi:class I adenylate-forming enzyme family protein [Streptomyces sp. NPDC003860]